MKKALIVAMLLAMASTLPAQVRDETILTFEVIQSERKSIVMEALELNAEQQQAMSPIYDKYMAEVSQLDKETAKLIRSFLAQYRSLSDDDARKMLERAVALRQAELDLRIKYLPKFGDVIPARKVLRLWQLENKLDTMIDAQLVKDIPLAK